MQQNWLQHYDDGRGAEVAPWPCQKGASMTLKKCNKLDREYNLVAAGDTVVSMASRGLI